jgi:aryl-alcohol dehydrogenase-like predicted oxidoreductase
MEYRKLGSSGLKVSVVGLGCNNFGMRIDEAASESVVHAALDRGINFFDTADIYGDGRSEGMLARAIKGLDRSKIVIATKFGMSMGDGVLEKGASRRYIMNAVEDSLRRLAVDYIDLYQQHQPDADTSVDETLRALDDLVRDGKVRHIGNSNYSGWQIADADWTSRHHGLERFVTAQNHYNLIQRKIEKDVLPACERFGLGMLPYFPLASGMLTGKYARGEAAPADTRLANFGAAGKRMLSDENFDRVDELTAYAEKRGHTILQLAMSWLGHNPAVSSVIAGATSPEQVAANVDAMSWSLTEDEFREVSELSK